METPWEHIDRPVERNPHKQEKPPKACVMMDGGSGACFLIKGQHYYTMQIKWTLRKMTSTCDTDGKEDTKFLP